MLAAMDLVAHNAASLGDRAVNALAVFDHLFDIGQGRAVVELDRFVMALEAERMLVVFEKAWTFGSVRRVTVQALSLRGDRSVLGCSLSDLLRDIFVTTRTERDGFRNQ